MDDLERNVRSFVAAGSGLATDHVIPGNDDGPRPKEPYASLLLIDDDRLAYPIRYQQPYDETVSTLTYRRAAYSLQFYRDGAVDHARRFVRYAESENGLTFAEDGWPLDDDGNKDPAATDADRFPFRVVQTPPLSVQRLDVPVGEQWEQRALVALSVDYADLSNEEAGYIDAFDCEVVYGEQVITGILP